MEDVSPRQVLVCLLFVCAVLAAWLLHGASAPAVAPGTVELTPQERSAGLRFAAGVAAGDRQWILAAIAGARPEARALIEQVDGTVEFRTHRGQPLGLATSSPSGSVITLDVASLDGRRQVDRPQTVLHELGHVVDYVLVSDRLAAKLDAGIPRQGTCGPTAEGPVGACTEPAERFADTFAKWAMRGAISAVGSGYSVPTPPSLEDWGAPLARLAAQAGD
jgi:hypothetical protein